MALTKVCGHLKGLLVTVIFHALQVPLSSTQTQWQTWDMQESLAITQSIAVLQTSR
jgi:hypothetical protein